MLSKGEITQSNCLNKTTTKAYVKNPFIINKNMVNSSACQNH